jgi:hypothetical protein
MPDRYQSQRYELKYFLTPSQAVEVREIVRSFLDPDEFSAEREELSYPVHSIYLDSEELATYWATVHCEKQRFKLRVRFYDDEPDSPVFLEIKRRYNETIRKERAAVRRSEIAALMAGEFPESHHMHGDGERHLQAAQTFVALAAQLRARPKVHVAYMREAWVERASNAVRVTLDRNVRGERVSDVQLSTSLLQPVVPFGDRVILELKFTNRFPNWFAELVRHFNLVQCGVPKYCGSVSLVGDDRLSTRMTVQADMLRYF